MRHTSENHDSGDLRKVALLIPGLIDSELDADALQRTIESNQLNLLICFPERSKSLLAGLPTVRRSRVQVLAADEVTVPEVVHLATTAPPGVKAQELIEYALAMSDVLLIGKSKRRHQLVRYAKEELGKTIITVGASYPVQAGTAADVTRGLDPQTSSSAKVWGCLLGRIEQFVMDVFASISGLLEIFSPSARGDGGKVKVRIFRAFRSPWMTSAYFAPGDWRAFCPDVLGAAQNAPITKCFEAMDRAALNGSYIHRGLTWVIYLAAAFAVSWGPAVEYWHIAWLVEPILLVGIAGAVVWLHRSKWRDRWTACRLGAEQLRIARMSLPLFILPPALRTKDVSPGEDGETPEEKALMQVKTAIRQQGLPRIKPEHSTPSACAKWLNLIVADQMRYHAANHCTLDRVERAIEAIALVVFGATIIALSFFGGHEWLLLLSVGGPAFVGALNGASVRLGIVHRAALSKDIQVQLGEIGGRLDSFLNSSPGSPRDWREFRDVGFQAATVMGAENSSWHTLVRRYRDELP